MAVGTRRGQWGSMRPGSWMTGPRLAGLGLLATALIGLWQAWRLERWSFDGPGPGLFPLMVASVFVVLALIVLIWPGRSAATEAGDTDAIDPHTQQRTRAGFALYGVSLLVLAAGSALAGFTVTAVAVSILIVRFAEHRSWLAALTYGIGCSVVGLVGFGWLLRVDLPSGPIERAFFSLVR
jgi:hypothetical protein